MQGLRFYYLEDVFDDFKITKENIELRGAHMLPASEEDWGKDLDTFLEYLEDNEEGRKNLIIKLQNLLLKSKPDAILLDYYLKGEDLNSSEIYNSIIRADKRFDDIPVIFFTIEPDETTLSIDSSSEYVQKTGSINSENINKLIDDIFDEIIKFDSIKKKLRELNYQPRNLSEKLKINH